MADDSDLGTEVPPFSLIDFPVEIICLIAARGGHEIYVPLMLTCKPLYDALVGNLLYLFGMGKEVRAFEKKSSFTAHPEQVKMLLALKNSQALWNIIRAPMGSGKTATMLMTALENPGRSIIIINTRIYTSWVQELKNFKINLVQDPARSDILMVHTKYPRHRDAFFKEVCFGKGPSKKIVVTTAYYVRKNSAHFRFWVAGANLQTEPNRYHGMMGLLLLDPTAPLGCVIIDEAHLLKSQDLWFLTHLEHVRHFLFSASPITFQRRPAGTIFRYEVKLVSTRGYPELSVSRIQTKVNPKYQEIIVAAVRAKTFNYKHVVVFSGHAIKILRAQGKSLADMDRLGTYKILTFSNTAPTILERWKKSEKGILLCNYQTSSEGTNFSEADCIIFMGFENVSSEKARQTLGRVRRKNNVHPEVKVYFCEPRDEVRWIRGRLNQKYALNLKMDLFTKKTSEMTRDIIRQLKEDGHDTRELSGEDLMAIFSYGHHKKPDICFKDLTLPLEEILSYSQM